MSEWYRLGLALGIGVGCGILLGGLLTQGRAALAAAAMLAAAAGAAIGLVLDNWTEAVIGGAGGVVGAVSTAELARGALRRGGTRGGTAVLLAAGGFVVAVLAVLPAVGYVEAVVVPVLAARLRRRAGERYAGLRTLARD